MAQEAFDNIVGYEGIFKLTYAADGIKDNTTEDGGGVHNELILKHSITVMVDKCENKLKAYHYYKTTIYMFKNSGIIRSEEYNIMYDANESSSKVRLKSHGFSVNLSVYLAANPINE